MKRKFYIYNLINKRQFSPNLKVCLVPECDIYNKPGVTSHLKFRKSNYITSNPFGEFYVVFVIVCEECELYDIESLVLKITKQYHPCLSDYPNNECRYGIHPEVLVDIISSACEYFKVDFTILRENDITREVDNDDFCYEHDPALENRLITHTYFKQPYDFERACKMPELRSFQIEALEAIEQVYADPVKHSMKLIIPCGTGKTVIFQEFAFKHRNDFRFIFYLTSTLKLIENMIDRWKEIFPDFVIVELSSSGSKYQMNELELTGLIDQGKKFIFFICDESFRHKADIVLQYNLIGGAKDKSLFIWDEAHKLSRNIANGNPLDSIRDPEFKVLWEKGLMFNIFCSATPVYGNYETDNPLYMNNPEYYGIDEYRFTDLEECIKAGFICDMRLVVKKDNIDVSNRFVSSGFDNRENVVRCLNTLYSLLADESLSYRPSKVIIYCTLKKEVDEFYNALSIMKNECDALHDFKLFRLYSGMDSDDSLHDFTNYRGKCIMLNIRMLNDGINVPDIDTILFTAPLKWKPDIIQRIFRARRALITRPDKMAYIIIPVAAYDIKDEMYDMVLKVLQELIEANDPGVIMFGKLRDRKSGSSIPTIGHFEIISDGFKFIDSEIQHAIITDLGNLFRITNLNAAILRTLQLYPMTVAEICEYINYNQLLTFTVFQEACKSLCDGMVLRNKVIYDGLKYFNTTMPNFDEDEQKFEDFIKRMLVRQITNETDYNEYCHLQNFSGEDVYIDPVWYFRKFRFSWTMIKPDEEKSYDFNVCKEVITKLLTDQDTLKTVTSINGYVKRIKILREKDKCIPHQNNIRQIYGLKNMGELHRLFRE